MLIHVSKTNISQCMTFLMILLCETVCAISNFCDAYICIFTVCNSEENGFYMPRARYCKHNKDTKKARLIPSISLYCRT